LVSDQIQVDKIIDLWKGSLTKAELYIKNGWFPIITALILMAISRKRHAIATPAILVGQNNPLAM
jgi:hypothetical protein